MRDALTFSGTNWAWPAAVLALVAALAVVWSYAGIARGAWRWLGALLRVAGVLALAACLLNPLWVGRRAKPGANLFAVVADNSAGLQVHDAGAAQSRGDDLRRLVALDPGGWQTTLGRAFDLRRFLFDARIQTTTDFHELAFDGRMTALGGALHSLRERFQNRPLAGVLLLTDGNATDLKDGLLPSLAGLPPVYPVVIGRTDAIRDIAVQSSRATQSSFEDAPVSVQVNASATGYRGRQVTARLLDPTGKTVQEQTTTAGADGDEMPFRFQVKPDVSGVTFYTVDVRDRAELDRPGPGSEATLLNNRAVVTVDRGRGPFRVLYVSGRPNWEFKFLNRAVESDRQLELVALIRVAKREPKFDFRGHAGEASNPLYRGFGAQAPEDVQPYDQPVLVRLNTRDETELRGGFPRTPEELYRYDALIVDHVEAEFFTPEQALLVQKFVSERGGGMLMLGGMESFSDGKYLRTPIGDMLPVYLEAGDPAPEEPLGDVHLELSKEGWLQPWARLRDNEGDERARLGGMPNFAIVNRVRGVKPGASVIATVRDERGTQFPALAVQRFGAGRSAALMVGDLWRWGMRDAASHADMDKSWRQLARWLVSDVPHRIDCTAGPTEDGVTMQLRVRVRDAKFQPVDDAKVVLTVEPVVPGETRPATETVRMEAEPLAGEIGTYVATYVPRLTAGYRATASVKSASGEDLGRAQAGWTSDLAGEEFRSLVPNRRLLEEIAQKTGGRVIAAADLPAFARQLPHATAPVMEVWTQPAWHTPVLFAFALLCFVTEWGLRRWKGLP